MLLVQEYLKHKTLKDLEIEHGIYTSFSKSKSFFSLNYDMILSRNDDPLSQQCRGVILSKPDGSIIDETTIIGDTIIMSLGFYRFFNEGQGAAAPIDWNDPNLKIYEKVDGTCIFVWFNPFLSKWNIATRGTPEADIVLDSNKQLTFSSLFQNVLKDIYGQSFDNFTSRLDQNITYIFELCTFYNRIVVQYPISQIFFIGARNLHSLKEYNIEDEIFDNQIDRIPKVGIYSFNNINDIIKYVSDQNPLQHEGVVVLDSNFNRIKVKNPMHGIFSRARDSLGTSDRNCLECILSGKEDDLIPVLPPEIVNNLLSIKSKYVLWLKKQEELFQTITSEASSIGSDKKTFALTVQKYKPDMQAAYFSIFDKKAISVRDFVDKNQPFSSSFLDKLLNVI